MINLTDRPSRLIDLAQWLGLFYHFLETADRQSAPADIRKMGFYAALCLEEALKFYSDNELPPESAFFTPTSQEAFRQHPEKFARQRLKDMRGRLPAIPKMVRRVDMDRQKAGKRWWQFWRRSG